MSEDFNFSSDEFDLNSNDTLYTDIAVQLMSSWFSGNTKVVNAVCEGVSNDMKDNPSAMPGILFGCIVHMTTMINKMAGMKGIETEEMWAEYLLEYNTVIRNKMVQIPFLHPEIARKAAEFLDSEDC